MVSNLAIGALFISITVVIHTVGLVGLTDFISRLIHRFGLHRHNLGKIVAMVATVLGIFLLHSVEIWIWAAWFLASGEIASFQDALYFSTVTFSTLGSSDVTLSPQWRLLGSLEAINGFILIGWSIAYLVAASTRHGPFRSGEHF